MSGKDLLGNVHAKGQFVSAGVVLQLAVDRNEARVVAPDNLVLDEALFERMTLLVGGGLLLEYLHQRLVDLFVVFLMHGYGPNCYNID